MERYGLIGFPLGHSFSQKYFTEKFKKDSIDARYDLFPMEKIEYVEGLLEEIDHLKGLNVTIPYKELVMSYLDEIDDEAASIGAVNVIRIEKRDGNRWLKGYNSDAYGFCESIKPLLKSGHKKALVLGTGGASKAVVHVLQKLGLQTMLVSRKKVEGLLSYVELDEEVIADYKVIVNASPVGTFPNCDACPSIPYNSLTAEHLCFDLVYNPEETLFLKKAKSQGAVCKNGLEMLFLQAEGAWKYWKE